MSFIGRYLKLFLVLFLSFPVYGIDEDSKMNSNFEKVFTVAGYTTLIGAGVGTAALVFSDNPSENARYVAVGASVGFVAGCLFGGYLVVSPEFEDDGEKKAGATLESIDIKASLWGTDSLSFEAKLNGAMTQLKAFEVHMPVWNF